MTDDAGQYAHIDKDFAEHGMVCHSADEYASAKDRTIRTNTVEASSRSSNAEGRESINIARTIFIGILPNTISGIATDAADPRRRDRLVTALPIPRGAKSS